MPDRTDVPPPALYLVRAKGANRISHMGASRISEAFDKDAAPTVGAICVAVQAGHDYFDDLDDEDLAKGATSSLPSPLSVGLVGWQAGR